MKLIPNIILIFSSLIPFSTLSLGLAQEADLDLEIFTHPKTAVKAAIDQDKQIVFVLHDETEDSHNEVLATFTRELNEHESNFVLVKCSSGREDFRTMFSDTFKQDITVLPLALLTDSKGKQITSAKGITIESYADMLVNALIATGVTDPIKLADVRARLDETLEIAKESPIGEGFFGLPLVKTGKRKAISSVRKWKKTDGTDFTGVLIAAKQTHGEFIDTMGHSFEVKFSSLSQPDIKYLQSTVGK